MDWMFGLLLLVASFLGHQSLLELGLTLLEVRNQLVEVFNFSTLVRNHLVHFNNWGCDRLLIHRSFWLGVRSSSSLSSCCHLRVWGSEPIGMSAFRKVIV